MTSTETNKPASGDPGPVPDILKREPQHLATPELVESINNDYSVILNSERANLPRALAIAEKLNALRARTIRGQWKTKFGSFGLKISYETASVYLRIWEHWPEITAMAAEKSVDPTLLTIDGARELWARRKETTEDDEGTEDTEDAEPDGEEESSDETEEEVVGKKWLEALAPDDLIFWLKEVHGDEYLKELAKVLAVELAKAVPPMPRPPVTAASVVAPPAATASAAATPSAGVRRM